MSRTEHHEQVAFMAWAAIMGQREPALAAAYAVPNAGKRGYGAANYMRAEGLKKGVPDICIPASRMGYGALYIEFKSRDCGGKVSKEQKTYHELLEGLGNAVEVAWTCEEAIKIAAGYLASVNRWTWTNVGKKKES